MRETLNPTTDQHGSERHPGFGQIQAVRGSNHPGAVLFDSDIKHQHTIRLTVTAATRDRDLNRDWIHSTGAPLIEVEMSEAQWASFVSSMNTSGVPCTVRATETQRTVPAVPYDPRLAHSMAEVHDGTAKTFGPIQAAMVAYDALDPKAPAKDRREALAKIRNAVRNAEANLNYTARTLTEHAENVVQRARADIEAMVGTEAARLGLTGPESERLLELPLLRSETTEEGGA
jgi:hypothetical protein